MATNMIERYTSSKAIIGMLLLVGVWLIGGLVIETVFGKDFISDFVIIYFVVLFGILVALFAGIIILILRKIDWKGWDNQGLKEDEKILLSLIAKSSQLNLGELYEKFHSQTNLGYTRFYEMLNKLESMKLIESDFTGKGYRDRSRVGVIGFAAKVAIIGAFMGASFGGSELGLNGAVFFGILFGGLSGIFGVIAAHTKNKR